ncbi:MAG: LuxR family transcriptional regulator [Rhodospirillales bacterium]|nr:LuxR family transcriptional regulator [Rhodospirillales bacterium]
MRMDDYIEQTNTASTPDEVVAVFKRAVSDLGYGHFACLASPNHGLFRTTAAMPLVVVDYPSEWQNHYAAQDYIAIDPVVKRTANARTPFLWEELGDLSDQQRQLFAEAGEAGLNKGVCVPIHGPRGEMFIASFASPSAKADSRRARPRLQMAAAQFYTAYGALLGLEDPATLIQLTPHQKQCLLWTGRGKSSWDIGMIMNISEHTVDYHLKRAMKRLGANNRILAVVTAIRLGLVEL